MARSGQEAGGVEGLRSSTEIDDKISESFAGMESHESVNSQPKAMTATGGAATEEQQAYLTGRDALAEAGDDGPGNALDLSKKVLT